MFVTMLDRKIDANGKAIFTKLIDKYGYKFACQGFLKSLEYNQKYGTDKIPGDIDGTGSFAFRLDVEQSQGTQICNHSNPFSNSLISVCQSEPIFNGPVLPTGTEGQSVHVKCGGGFLFVDGTDSKTFTCSAGTWSPDPSGANCANTKSTSK